MIVYVFRKVGWSGVCWPYYAILPSSQTMQSTSCLYPECPEYSEYSEYPEYPKYSEYPEYPEYPEYSEYPEYPEYSEYPEYPEYPEYSEYPEYPEYSEYSMYSTVQYRTVPCRTVQLQYYSKSKISNTS